MADSRSGDGRFDIEPFDRTKHDRSSFACGVVRIDNFLKLSAKKQQIGNYTRVFVATETGSPIVRGFYAMTCIQSNGVICRTQA